MSAFTKCPHIIKKIVTLCPSFLKKIVTVYPPPCTKMSACLFLKKKEKDRHVMIVVERCFQCYSGHHELLVSALVSTIRSDAK